MPQHLPLVSESSHNHSGDRNFGLQQLIELFISAPTCVDTFVSFSVSPLRRVNVNKATQ